MRRRFQQMQQQPEQEKFLDVDASMQGTLSFRDPVNLRINGNFEGVLNTKGTLMIGEKAVVAAEINGELITVAGKVNGNIKALRELKIVSPAVINGNIETPILSVAEGAIVDGQIRMTTLRTGDFKINDVLSIDQVASYLEVDRGLVAEWANNGKLPGVKDGNEWQFNRTVVDSWVANEKIN